MGEVRWSETRARAWYEKQAWLVGCNFIPSTAVNQLEMWQEPTFDLQTIESELAWAAGLGFNTVRVYLHDLAWEAGPGGFKQRVDGLLAAASRNGIRPLLVVFDDCWYEPRPGVQAEPRPGVHNSRWVKSPGAAATCDRRQWERLEAYVRDIVGSFGGDERVLAWDLYNEVTNDFLPALGFPQPRRALALGAIAIRRKLTMGAKLTAHPSVALLEETFRWARSARPAQPLTAGAWLPDRKLDALLIERSDVLSFHNYRDANELARQIAELKRHRRPLLCTEYLARTQGSRFETCLPLFKREGVGCYNWGLVSGRTQTRFSWRARPGCAEPEPWFHDILRADGSAYRPAEVDLIRNLCGLAPDVDRPVPHESDR